MHRFIEGLFVSHKSAHNSVLRRPWSMGAVSLLGATGVIWGVASCFLDSSDIWTKSKQLLFWGVLITFFGLGWVVAELLRLRRICKRQSQELLLGNLWLKQLLAMAVEGIHVMDMQGKLIGCSPSFAAMLEYEMQEMQRLHVTDWEAKLTPDAIVQRFQKLSSTPMTLETLFRCASGKIIDVEIKATLIEQEGVQYVFASSCDITKRKANERALRAEKERAQNYLDIVEVMVLVINPDMTIGLINRKGSEVLGYTPQEAIGKVFTELFIPLPLREEMRRVAHGLLSYDGVRTYENIIVTKSAEERRIAWRNTPLVNEAGFIVGILSAGEDITDTRRTQELLHQNETFYKTIFGAMDEAIVIIQKGVVIDCNTLALSLLRLHRDAFIGAEFLEVMPRVECQEQTFEAFIETAYTLGFASSQCSVYFEAHNDLYRVIDFSFSRLGGERERKVIMMARDITRQIEEERMLTLHARQAQMGEMISMIAHQWRQPLAIINAITSQMRLKALLADQEDAKLIGDLVKIEAQSRHLSQTISDYQDFFRPDKEKELFDVVALVENALTLIDYALKNHSIHIEVDALTNVMLFGFRNELLQVFIALFKNSLDAFVENRIIDGEIRIAIGAKANKCVIAITDNAGGISDAVMGRLFLPYFTTKSKNTGTGLGLYMSRIIVQEHCGGTITVASQGTHTTFTIRLPYEKRL